MRKMDPKFPTAEIKAILKFVDVDEDGNISLEEFKRLFRQFDEVKGDLESTVTASGSGAPDSAKSRPSPSVRQNDRTVLAWWVMRECWQGKINAKIDLFCFMTTKSSCWYWHLSVWLTLRPTADWAYLSILYTHKWTVSDVEYREMSLHTVHVEKAPIQDTNFCRQICFGSTDHWEAFSDRLFKSLPILSYLLTWVNTMCGICNAIGDVFRLGIIALTVCAVSQWGLLQANVLAVNLRRTWPAVLTLLFV